MRNIFKSLLFLLVAVSFFSCEKDENQVIFEGGTAPVLTASSTTIPLSFVNKDKNALTLNWTNPDYKFNTGLSSQDVTYTIEIDTTGANFTNPKKQTLSISKELSRSFTQTEFNGILLNQLVLTPDISHQIEIRVTSSLSNNNVALPSNVLKYTVTPYAIPPVVTPPASGELFITGSATPVGWQCACGEAPVLSQKFTKLSPTLFTLTINLTGDGSYLLLPQYASWSAKYGFTGANNANNVNGDDFKDGGGDIKAPAASGTYKIEVDFQRGKFTVTKI